MSEIVDLHSGEAARFCPKEPGFCGPVFSIPVQQGHHFTEVLICGEDLYEMSAILIKATGRDPDGLLDNPDSPIACGCGADCCLS